MTEYRSSFEQGGALLFDQQSIEDFVKAANAFLEEEAKLAIGFEGDHTIEGNSVAELFDDPYVRSFRIKSIKIYGRSSIRKDTPWRSLNIKIDRDDSTPVSVAIDGDRDACVAIRTQIELLLKGRWLWYAPLYRPAGLQYNLLRGFFGWVASLAVMVLGYLLVRGVPQTIWSLLDLLVISLGFASWVYWLFYFLRTRMFPRLLFDVGKSAERVRSAASWRQAFWVSFVLSVLASIAAAIFLSPFKL